MDDRSLFRRSENILRYEQELTECRLVKREPVRIYSVSGTLLREYPDFCEIDIPESDRVVIRHQIMIQCHESDVAFSKKDLLFASEYQLFEIRLIGRSSIFSMKPHNRVWPDPRVLAMYYDEIDTSADLISRLEETKNSPALAKNSWDPEVDILIIRSDCICKKISEIFHLDYRKAPFLGCYNYPKKR
jgi:hypothetical protein